MNITFWVEGSRDSHIVKATFLEAAKNPLLCMDLPNLPSLSLLIQLLSGSCCCTLYIALEVYKSHTNIVIYRLGSPLPGSELLWAVSNHSHFVSFIYATVPPIEQLPRLCFLN